MRTRPNRGPGQVEPIATSLACDAIDRILAAMGRDPSEPQG
jgi:hypothetical protein